MIEKIAWKIAGQQGEGVESTNRIFAFALNRLGYYLYGYRHFSSRILGGHTHHLLRISKNPVQGAVDQFEILVALDQESLDRHLPHLLPNGVALFEEHIASSIPSTASYQGIPIPFKQLAKELGSPLVKNLIAAGASWSLLGLPIATFLEATEKYFEHKDSKTIERNREAVKCGATYIQPFIPQIQQFHLGLPDFKEKIYMIGNEAIGMGALAAGCRFISAYPITPSSEIFEYLVKKLPDLGGKSVQTEDEISAVMMAIGSNYGGVRAMTASSGPGLSLMIESIGLSGMTETPLVIVNAQRGGPSTGLPTKQEQSDIHAMIYGTHGEIPKIILAPTSVEECFYDTIEAFNLAEIYQCPVILLLDLQLALGKQSCEIFDYEKIKIERGSLLSEHTHLDEKTYFPRYDLEASGISKRAFPGHPKGIHHVTGLEHNIYGQPCEDSEQRKKMMDKRMEKLSRLSIARPLLAKEFVEDPDFLFIGMGSTLGVMEEVIHLLNEEGIKSNYVLVRQIHPFPTQEFCELAEKAKVLVVVEHNATGQLADQVKLHTNRPVCSVLKYDGNPFYPHDILRSERIHELISRFSKFSQA